MYQALTADDYSRGESNRSVTQLIDSPRARILRSDYSNIVTVDASELVWIALGKAIHTMFEKYATGKYLPEERLFAEVDGWTVSGAIDIQYTEGKKKAGKPLVKLADYKSTSVWSVIFGGNKWAEQLNFYAWLAEQAKDVLVDKLTIIVILKDWKQGDLEKRGSDYPQAPILEIDVPLWSQDERDRYVRERVRIHQDAEFQRLTGGVLPFCTDEERWKNPSEFAVKKPANKRAMKVFSGSEEAWDYIAKQVANPKNKIKQGDLTIEERPSIPTRCAKLYCKIAPWCDQYQAELAREAKETDDE